MAETRTLKVLIAGDSKGARYAIKGTADEVEKLEDKTDKANSSMARFTERVKSFGTVFSRTTKTAQVSVDRIDTKSIDDELTRTRKHLADLNREFAETGNRDLFGKMRKDRSLIANLTKISKEVGEVGAEAGKNFTSGFGDALGALGPQVKGAAIVAGALLAVNLAPLLGGILSSAVVGGAGIGGIVGGVALAARDSRVQAAAKSLGEYIMTTLEGAATSFVPATLSAIGIVKNEFADMTGDLKATFQAAAKYVEPLTRAVMGMVKNVMPGLRRAIESAGPVIAQIGAGLEGVGEAIGDMFSTLAGNAKENAAAMHFLFIMVEGSIRLFTVMIDVLTEVFGWLVNIGDVASKVADDMFYWIPGVGKLTEGWRNNFEGMKGAMEGAGEQGKTTGTDLGFTFQRISESATGAAANVESFADAISRLTQENLDARASTRSAEEAIDAAAEALRKNGKTLDDNTAKGRANNAALDGIASASNRAYEATLAQTGSQEEANKVLTRGRDKFIAMAVAMGMDAEKAKILAGQLFAIPSVTPKVTVQQQQAIDAIAEVTRNLKGVKSKNIHIGVYWKSNGDLKVPGGTLTKDFSTGGLVRGPGTGTSDSILSRISNGEFVLRAAAVKRLGVGFLNRLNHADRKGVPSMPGGGATRAHQGGLAERSLAAAGPSYASQAVNVVVHVGGNVATERDLARSIATTVRDEIARKGKRNGGSTGL